MEFNSSNEYGMKPGNLQRACRRLAQGELPASRKSSILVLIGIIYDRKSNGQ